MGFEFQEKKIKGILAEEEKTGDWEKKNPPLPQHLNQVASITGEAL